MTKRRYSIPVWLIFDRERKQPRGLSLVPMESTASDRVYPGLFIADDAKPAKRKRRKRA